MEGSTQVVTREEVSVCWGRKMRTRVFTGQRREKRLCLLEKERKNRLATCIYCKKEVFSGERKEGTCV